MRSDGMQFKLAEMGHYQRLWNCRSKHELTFQGWSNWEEGRPGPSTTHGSKGRIYTPPQEPLLELQPCLIKPRFHVCSGAAWQKDKPGHICTHATPMDLIGHMQQCHCESMRRQLRDLPMTDLTSEVKPPHDNTLRCWEHSICFREGL